MFVVGIAISSFVQRNQENNRNELLLLLSFEDGEKSKKRENAENPKIRLDYLLPEPLFSFSLFIFFPFAHKIYENTCKRSQRTIHARHDTHFSPVKNFLYRIIFFIIFLFAFVFSAAAAVVADSFFSVQCTLFIRHFVPCPLLFHLIHFLCVICACIHIVSWDLVQSNRKCVYSELLFCVFAILVVLAFSLCA